MTVKPEEPTPATRKAELLEIFHMQPLLPELAVRRAITFQGAAATCRRSICRETRICHARCDERDICQCAARYDAAAAVTFAAEMIMFHLEYLPLVLFGEAYANTGRSSARKERNDRK